MFWSEMLGNLKNGKKFGTKKWTCHETDTSLWSLIKGAVMRAAIYIAQAVLIWYAIVNGRCVG